MSSLQVQFHRFSIINIAVLLFSIFHVKSAAPPIRVASSNNSIQEMGNRSSIFSELASKTLGAFLKAASYVWQWMPRLPEWMRPAKPILRLVKSTIPNSSNNIPKRRFDETFQDYFDI